MLALAKRYATYCSFVIFILLPLTACVSPPKESKHLSPPPEPLSKTDIDKTILEVKLALQGDPLNADAHYMLGTLLAKQGLEEQAMIGFQRAIALDPTNPKALHNLGTLLLHQGQTVTAAKLLEYAVLYDPDYIPPYNSLAKAYYSTGLPELALATYEEVLSRDETNRIARNNLALLIAAAGEASTNTKKELTEEPTESSENKETNGKQNKRPASGNENANNLPTAKQENQQLKNSGNPAAYTEKKARELRELLRDLQYITVEDRAGMLTVSGWVRGPREQAMLDRILKGWPQVLNLTGVDAGDPQRMLEVDAVIFVVIGVDSESIGFNFLRQIDLSYTFFSSSDVGTKWTGLNAPGSINNILELPASGSLLVASVDYDVNIANASDDRVAVLARPHLTTLNGTPATFIAGGEVVFKVTGNIGGNIKPYPFGTSIAVTPTILRTPGSDGKPRIHLDVKADRTSILEVLVAERQGEDIIFDKLSVTSQAVLDLGQTLILSGLSQRESRTSTSGVPILKNIPLLKYVFSNKTTIETNTSIIMLLTPRDPAFMDEQNRQELRYFIEKRRAFLKAQQGTAEDMRKFQAQYPDWRDLAPNRFASHFFLTRTSELYRRVSNQDLIDEDLDLDLLGDFKGAQEHKGSD